MTPTQTQGRVLMTDGGRLHWTALGEPGRHPPVVMLHGGPGLPDDLGELAPMVADLALVYRYDQRGTGRSPWQGDHLLARHVQDLAELLDAWATHEAVLIGHSYGADLASRFCLSHPDRVAAVLLMSGPFLGDWHTRYRAERARRMTTAQQARLRALKALPRRTGEQEDELLTLAWFTDHTDPEHGRHRAAQAARRRRPVNWDMNRRLSEQTDADPLDAHLDGLRARLPARSELLGGVEDPRPISALETLACRLALPMSRIEGAGHEPWSEQPGAVRAHLRRFLREAQAP